MSNDQYSKGVMEMRREKDEYFWRSDDSPVPYEERHRSKGLSYFTVDPKFRVKAHLTRYESPDTVILPTSTGTQEEYLKYGAFEFTIDGRLCRLIAFKAVKREDGDSLFVPFRDKTSGRESYAAARYLDIPEVSGSEYIVDFNVAYNPYCAYSDGYVCPLPPQENTLNVEIRAGEKRLHKWRILPSRKESANATKGTANHSAKNM